VKVFRWPVVIVVGAVVAAVGFVGGYWDPVDHAAVDARHAAARIELQADDVEGRVHGVTELEQVIKQSPDDQPTVVTELTAFVRATTDAKDCRQVGRDVQTALSVLARRQVGSDRGTVLDLHGTCLRNANLTRAVLDGADLSGAKLVGTNLRDAHVVAANLASADLDGARTEGLHIA
jgi:hypothetical protein